MPIVITNPADGDPFGPAFHISAVSDFVGPLEPGSFWRITLTAPANEFLQLEMTHPWETNGLAINFYNNTFAIPIPVGIGIQGWTGMPGQVRITLEEPTAGVVDTGDQQIIVDRTTGQASELKQWLDWKLAQQPVGLTTAEGEQLARVEAGVTLAAGFGPLDAIAGLATAIVSSPPLGWGTMSGAYTISGDGELPDLHEFAHDRFGVYWIATVIPPGLGHFHGNTEEYQTRLVQWRTTHVVGGIEQVTEVFDADWHGGLWRFASKLPEKVQYSILPGVQLQARWWQFP